jgi:hypothetical protein
MVCPSCSAPAAEGAGDCVSCGVIFEKWRRRQAAPAQAAPAVAPEWALLDARSWAAPAAPALLFALFHASRFASYLPLTEGWGKVETWLLPLSALTVVFHEGGHVIFGLLGWRFLTVAGGTIMQLALPLAIIAHFARRRETAGTLFGAFWLGESLIGAAYYAADAKMQVLILIGGMSGSEGGGHDWAYMLGRWGLTNSCVGVGRFVFFWGCLAMALPLCWTARAAWRRAWR